MKHFLLTLLILVSVKTISFGQELAIIQDTVKNYQIGVPVGWKYGVPADQSLDLIAFRQKQSEEDVPRENLNINILHRDETSLDATYSEFLKSIGTVEGFTIIEEGDTVINDRKYKYLIESHKNKYSKEDMHNYVLFTNKEGAILILTMVTISPNFDTYRTLFDKIAGSLHF
ncbi:hypothetical protein [Pontibacter sp. HSC-36F09]|uniref:hypothetical protein n=1 Tax=Pontibacter sp. HSC-36F09 TaxID=2910966 RepID=UPI00209FB582|nr:hypothetical protein [Pontibacter sp. HSC-36F09]MCP2042180.1 hypothetical protein [Pontibacter sp. HSC-36F09]